MSANEKQPLHTQSPPMACSGLPPNVGQGGRTPLQMHGVAKPALICEKLDVKDPVAVYEIAILQQIL